MVLDSASRRIHTTTTKEKKHTLPHEKFRVPQKSDPVRGGMSVPKCGRAQTPEGRRFSRRFSRTFGRESIHRSVFLSWEQQKSRFFFSSAGSALLLRLLARDGGDDGSRAQRWPLTAGDNAIGKKRLKHGKVLSNLTGHFQNTKLLQNLSKTKVFSSYLNWNANISCCANYHVFTFVVFKIFCSCYFGRIARLGFDMFAPAWLKSLRTSQKLISQAAYHEKLLFSFVQKHIN